MEAERLQTVGIRSLPTAEHQEQRPAYYFTRLNKIKPAMLREATKNARIAANEFAENAG